MEEWSNAACFGYVIRALEIMEQDGVHIQVVINVMKRVMDTDLSVEEAIEVYNKSPY